MGDSNSEPEPENLTRNIANFNIGGNYEVKKAAPLDNRMCTPYRSDLISNNWVTYQGMICEVINDGDYNGLYELTDKDSKIITNWRKVNSYRPSKQILDPNNVLYNIVQNVGGFDSSSGWGPTYLNDFTYDQLFDILLFPLQNSIKVNPMVNIQISPSGDSYDLNDTFFLVNDNITFNMNVNITGNNVTLNGKELIYPYTGDISSAYYIGFDGNTVDLSFIGHYINPISFTHTILPGDQSLTVYITYHDGSFAPYNTKGTIDTSSTDLTNNNNQYRGPSGEYLSQTHNGNNIITGIYPAYINFIDTTGESFTQLAGKYRFSDNIDFQLNWRVEPNEQFKFAISKLRFDEISNNHYNISFKEDTLFNNTFENDNCKFYANNDSFTLNDLSYNDIDISINDIIGDVSYVVFKTQYNNVLGSLVAAPIKFRFVVE